MKSPYGKYLDGKTRYSAPHPASNDHNRMVGAALMRAAVVRLLKPGKEQVAALDEEVARDLAHWLEVLNCGRAIGLFVPLALRADGAAAIVCAPKPDTIQARVEIIESLKTTRTVPERYRERLVQSFARADGGQLADLASPAESGTEQETPAPVGAGRNAKPEWTRKAWKIGTEWMLAEEKQTGERPTVVDIAKYVEGELSTRGITGVRGKYLDWESIKRDALTGITGRGKGENFKNAMGNPHRKKKSPIAKA